MNRGAGAPSRAQQLFCSPSSPSPQGDRLGVPGRASPLAFPTASLTVPSPCSESKRVASPSISQVKPQRGAVPFQSKSCGRISVQSGSAGRSPAFSPASPCSGLPGSPVHAPSRHHLRGVRWYQELNLPSLSWSRVLGERQRDVLQHRPRGTVAEWCLATALLGQF